MTKQSYPQILREHVNSSRLVAHAAIRRGDTAHALAMYARGYGYALALQTYYDVRSKTSTYEALWAGQDAEQLREQVSLAAALLSGDESVVMLSGGLHRIGADEVAS